MKLEFLAEGSQDCPLIRLYAFDVGEAVQLRKLFRSLSTGSRQAVALHEEPGTEPVGGCRLDLHLGKGDSGVVPKGLLKFECILTPRDGLT